MPTHIKPHPASLAPDVLLQSCQWTRGRASGPGGQHRNKVETAMAVLHLPTQISAQASERRSQAQNKRVALFRLRLNLARGYRVPFKACGDLWASRCKQGRIAINPEHDDFPAMLAMALDALACHGQEPAQAAKVLGCSASALMKLLKKDPPAWQMLNQSRQALDLHALK